MSGNAVKRFSDYSAKAQNPKAIPHVFISDLPNIGFDELNPGDELIVLSLIGWVKAKVTKIDSIISPGHQRGEATAEDTYNLYSILYDPEQKCWTCSAVLNKAAIKKLEL